MKRTIAIGLLLLLAFGVLPQAASAHQVCFPKDKTPYCLAHPFSDYWEANGGLPVFGYPITYASDEINRDTGRVYFTQWAERNRFEQHPENKGTPYEVLLGLLGKDRLAQLGRGADRAESGPKAGCLWFKETGHNVCNQQGSLGFKTYWETHGLSIAGLDTYSRSLQLFGLPLTEPRMETNAAGDRVQTQWFERARFEWHPNNPDEFKVLLGLLGAEVRAGGATLPTPPPVNVPAPKGACATNAPAAQNGAQAWVTVPKPASNGSTTLCVRLVLNGAAVNGAAVTARAYYETGVVSVGSATTGSDGVAAITINVGGAKPNYTVVVSADARYSGQLYSAIASFTPQ